MEIQVERRTQGHTDLNQSGVCIIYEATFKWDKDEERDMGFAKRRAIDAIGDQIVEDACKYIDGKYAPNHVQAGMGIYYHTSVLPDIVIAGKRAIETLLSKLVP